RMRQLKMVTSYLTTIFGASAETVLQKAGSTELQNRYQNKGDPASNTVKDRAFRYLDASLKHRLTELDALRGVKDEKNPEAQIAKAIEEALMEEVLKGGVI
ncbi:MAG: hypothetical protein WCJ30_15165, partial [Deltaproteobacteria bacterium]